MLPYLIHLLNAELNVVRFADQLLTYAKIVTIPEPRNIAQRHHSIYFTNGQ